jgi:hypothetical protein
MAACGCTLGPLPLLEDAWNNFSRHGGGGLLSSPEVVGQFATTWEGVAIGENQLQLRSWQAMAA